MHLPAQNQEIRLINRPNGKISPTDFAAADTPLHPPQDDQVIVKVRWLSMDTYLQERATSNAMGPMVPLGDRMVGRGLGVVVSGPLKTGTLVRGEFGWQRYATVRASELTPVENTSVPETWHLSALGTPGLTAWLGLHHWLLAGKPKTQGKTILISSAAGTVGTIAGQLARAEGLDVVGIAGGAKKCARLQELGFRATIDRHTVTDWPHAIQQAAPAGVDYYFDNTGGKILEAAVQCANAGARLLLCGHSGEYDGPSASISSQTVLYKRLSLQGFLVWDYADAFPEAAEALAQAAAQGSIQLDETIHHGLASAPAALRAMLDGNGIGKHLVRLED